MEQTFIGIDVSKDRLDVHVRPSGASFAVARDGKGCARRPHMDIQPILRNIDADESLFHDPSLQMRSRIADQATVRVHMESGPLPR